MKGSTKIKMVLIIWVSLLTSYGLFKILHPLHFTITLLGLILIRELLASIWLDDFPDHPSTAKFSLTYSLGPSVKRLWVKLIKWLDDTFTD